MGLLKFGEHPVTFGDELRDDYSSPNYLSKPTLKKPLENIITGKNDYLSQQCIDYIIKIELKMGEEGNLENRIPPFTLTDKKDTVLSTPLTKKESKAYLKDTEPYDGKRFYIDPMSICIEPMRVDGVECDGKGDRSVEIASKLTTLSDHLGMSASLYIENHH